MIIDIHVRLGDLDGNNVDNTSDYILTTTYTYDKNGNLNTVKTPDDVTITYGYDNMDRQKSVSQPWINENMVEEPITTSTTYNWEGKPLTTTDAKTKTTTYTYNKRGFLEKVIDALEGVTSYYYDTAGRKIAEISPKNYDPQKTLLEMNRTEYTYDTMGRMKTKVYKYTDTNGNWTTIVAKAFKYDLNGNTVKELDALGFDSGTGTTDAQKIETGYGTEYTYNLINKVKTVTDPVSKERALPYTTKYEYDGLLRKISETNAKGVITSYTYDDAGNILNIKIKKKADALDEKTIKSATYDLLGNALTQTDGNGNTTTYEYNTFSKVRKVVTPGDDTIPSNTVFYQYDMMGNLKYKKDIQDTVDIYAYDRQGRNTSHTQKKQDGSEAITTSVKYDKNGNKWFEFDGKGTKKENTYDDLNRLVETKITVSGIVHKTTYGYDKNGNQTTQSDWRNNTFTNIYDPLNRLIEKRDPYYDTTGKYIQKLEYNKNSLQEKSYDALGNLTQYRYDRNNRLIETIDPELHKTGQSYDDVGNVRTKTDGRNISTTYNYDEFNRLISVVNAKTEKVSYTYDLNGNMLSQTDGKDNTTTFEYNVANKLTRKINQGGRLGTPGSYIYLSDKVESYTYDVYGNLKTKLDRSSVTATYTYDIHGRLKKQEAGELSVSYTYDDNGNQLTMTDSTGTTTRTYDELNRVITKTVPHIGTTTFEYDKIDGVPDGCWMEVTTDPKTNITKKVYDKVGRLYWVIEGESLPTVYTYYENGSRKSVTYPGGEKEEYTYYGDGLLQMLVNKKADGTVMDSYTYYYDGAHNQTSKDETINGVRKGVTSNTYDSLNRLESVTEPGGKLTSYTYDKAGNRATETVKEGSVITITSYNYDEQNRLSNSVATCGAVAEKVTYNYDNNGNMVYKAKSVTKPADPGVQGSFNVYRAGTVENTDVSFYRYDVFNQLTQTIIGDKTVTYSYNGDGYRVEKNINGTLTRYLYEYDKVMLETDGQNNQTARNVYGTNLLSRTAGSDRFFYMYNGHADVTALLGTDGSVQASYYYDAFGNITEQTGNVSNPIRYSGYMYDDETKLYYLNARMYDPKIARFMQEDTYTGNPNDPLSLNLYTYCHNEPIMYWDPTGHANVTVTWEGIITTIDSSQLSSYKDSGWSVFNGNAYANMTNFGNVSTISTPTGSNYRIDNMSSGNISSVNTGASSNTSISNYGNIGTVNTGASSNTSISNYNNIGAINTGTKSTNNISNYNYIGIINTGAESRNSVSNTGNSFTGIINTGLGNRTDISDDTGVMYAGGKGTINSKNKTWDNIKIGYVNLFKGQFDDLINYYKNLYYNPIGTTINVYSNPHTVLGATNPSIDGILRVAEKIKKSIDIFNSGDKDRIEQYVGENAGELTEILALAAITKGASKIAGIEPAPVIKGTSSTPKVYNANGDAALRVTRRPAFDSWVSDGVEVNGQTFKMNSHAENSLFKSGRKDIMPDDITDALATKPQPAQPGSVMYVNPTTGTKVYVNPTTKEIVGVQPVNFKD